MHASILIIIGWVFFINQVLSLGKLLLGAAFSKTVSFTKLVLVF
jgi:hypothetical protein